MVHRRGYLDAAVLRAVAEVEGTPTVRKARAKIRERLGVSLTNREIARAIRRADGGRDAGLFGVERLTRSSITPFGIPAAARTRRRSGGRP